MDLSNPTAISATQTTIEVDAPPHYLSHLFDLNRSNGVGFVSPHPRYPLFSINGVYIVYPVAFNINASGVNVITIDHSITGSAPQAAVITEVNRSGRGKIIKRGEIKRVTLGTNELKVWPECVNEALSSQVSTTLHTGINGAIHAISINGSLSNTTLRATPLADQRGGHMGRVHLWYS